jgi:hypothetical protein
MSNVVTFSLSQDYGYVVLVAAGSWVLTQVSRQGPTSCNVEGLLNNIVPDLLASEPCRRILAGACGG